MSELTFTGGKNKKVVDIVQSNLQPQLRDIAQFLNRKISTIHGEMVTAPIESYEFHYSGAPLDYESLYEISQIQDFEVELLTIYAEQGIHFENGSNTQQGFMTRVITGHADRTDTSTILPAIDYFYNFDSPPKLGSVLLVPDGYPIVLDNGEQTGQLWEIDLHNHPDQEIIPSDPYPSGGDLITAPYKAKIPLIVSKGGLTIYGKPNDKITLPAELEKHRKGRDSRSLLGDIGFILEISKYFKTQYDTEKMGSDYQRYFKEFVCNMFQAPVVILDWVKDEGEIRDVINRINRREFDPELFFSEKKSV